MFSVPYQEKCNKPQKSDQEPSSNLECKIALVKLSRASDIKFSIFNFFSDNFRDILLLFHCYFFPPKFMPKLAILCKHSLFIVFEEVGPTSHFTSFHDMVSVFGFENNLSSLHIHMH